MDIYFQGVLYIMSKSNRTTIYLDDNYTRFLNTLTDNTGMNKSELIRSALIVYQNSDEYKKKKEEEKNVLKTTN